MQQTDTKDNVLEVTGRTNFKETQQRDQRRRKTTEQKSTERRNGYIFFPLFFLHFPDYFLCLPNFPDDFLPICFLEVTGRTDFEGTEHRDEAATRPNTKMKGRQIEERKAWKKN